MSSTTVRTLAASCDVPGVDGPSRDAVLVGDWLLGVADATEHAPDAADQLLRSVAAQLGTPPHGGDLARALERVLGATTTAGGLLVGVLTGAAMAVVEADTVTTVQFGSARAFRVRDGSLLPLPAADPAVVAGVADPIRAGEQYLLCTDGLWRSLDAELLAQVAGRHPVDACVRFHQLALTHSATDVAAVVFRLALGG
jgi:serine/threonine protein phosphatase PrpC